MRRLSSILRARGGDPVAGGARGGAQQVLGVGHDDLHVGDELVGGGLFVHGCPRKWGVSRTRRVGPGRGRAVEATGFSGTGQPARLARRTPGRCRSPRFPRRRRRRAGPSGSGPSCPVNTNWPALRPPRAEASQASAFSGLPERVGAGTAPDLPAVDRHCTPHGGEIERRVEAARRAEHASRVEEIVRDQRRSVDRHVVDPAIVDDLDAGGARLDRRRHVGAARRAGRAPARSRPSSNAISHSMPTRDEGVVSAGTPTRGRSAPRARRPRTGWSIFRYRCITGVVQPILWPASPPSPAPASATCSASCTR